MISLFSILKIAFNGEIIIEQNKIRTTKRNKNNMVLGLKVLKTSSNPLMGIALFDVNEEKNMFRFYIKIPLSHE